MNLEDFQINLDKLDSDYELGRPANDADIGAFESSIGVSMPSQVREFYKFSNGLKVTKPSLEIYPLSKMRQDGRTLVFCKLSDEYELAFDTSTFNAADQWSIVNVSSGYVVTLTMASFWSNKIWVWLRQRREIWAPESYT